MSKQKVNARRRKLCQEIINQHRIVSEYVSVRAAFMNGQLPHGIALAWTGPRDAFLVNFKNKSARQYVRDGKFLMKRVLMPVRYYIPEIRPVGLNECPGCINPTRDLTHNQFCDSLKDRYSDQEYMD